MQASIPFTVRADIAPGDNSSAIPGVEGYVLELHGLYLSVPPMAYSLTDGPASLQITGFQGLQALDGSSTISFVPSATESVNLPIPVRGRALGPGSITLTKLTGGTQQVRVYITAWGELIPVTG